ncbi:unnamed protein product, partial [Brassica rapa subsp. trilocularis]
VTKVESLDAERCDQRPNKVRFCIDKSKAQEVTKELYQRLEKRGVHVLPKGGGKGQALAYLLNKLKAEGKLPVKILVCGNSGKDTELFTLNVSNSQDSREQCKDNPREGGVENCEAYVASPKSSCVTNDNMIYFLSETPLMSLGRTMETKRTRSFQFGQIRFWQQRLLLGLG